MVRSYSLREDTLTGTQSQYLKLAANVALESSCVQRHGAVIVKGGSVLSVGVNKYINDPHQFPDDYFTNSAEHNHIDPRDTLSIHAEVAALRKLSKKQRRGATLYVARIAPSGKVSNSAPCDLCAKRIFEAGIKKVIFS